MPKDMQLSLRIRGEYHLMKYSGGVEHLDACFVTIIAICTLSLHLGAEGGKLMIRSCLQIICVGI